RRPEAMWAVGAWYEHFGQTRDEEVIALLERAASAPGAPAAEAAPAGRSPEPIEIALPGGMVLQGDLARPPDASGLVIFAHGSGSSRRSPRNRDVATALREAGLATLLMDLLTVEEERYRAAVFDVELLAARLVAATRWARGQAGIAELAIGYFGASTGAAAALWAASELPKEIAAVVSRGGRPDLAGPRLDRVRAPVLLIVGGRDDVVLDLNRSALRALRCPADLQIVPGATHLFEEPGTLAQVAELASGFFREHLSARGA
ncbi:MAG: dienelactone hydrolase family protein, partial [Solirubrobacteraceae bacterium]